MSRKTVRNLFVIVIIAVVLLSTMIIADYNYVLHNQKPIFCFIKNTYDEEEIIEYVGFGAEEWRRVQKAVARNEKIGRKVAFPIFEKKIPSDEIKRIITQDWKIKLPKAYDDLQHNNCIPCFKAGKDSWRVYYHNYREQFDKAVEMEEKIGHTVFKNVSLKQLAEQWEKDAEWDKLCDEVISKLDAIKK